MAGFFHGIRTRQLPTSLTPPARIETAIPMVFGCAPIHRLPTEEQASKLRQVVLLYTLAEAEEFFGIDVEKDDFTKWGISEVAYCKFVLFGSAPILAVNVFDPAIHTANVAAESVLFSDGVAKLAHSDVIGNLTLRNNATTPFTYTENTHYTLNRVTGVVTVVEDSQLATDIEATGMAFTAAYTRAAPENVTAAQVISATMLTEEAFPKFRLIPNVLIAPNFSQIPAVAAALVTRTQRINGIFNAGGAIADIPTEGTDAVTLYSSAPAYKNAQNLVSENLYLCYGKVRLGDDIMNMSTQAACILAEIDARNGFPHESPSNENLKMQALIVNGNEVVLDLQKANFLNANGITTALNFVNGWVLWGNRTACYPGVLDTKDTFFSSRRMLAWHGNRFILSYWSRLDKPMTRVWIETIVNSENIFIAGVVAAGALLGGRIELNQEQNPITDLMDGKVVFHTLLGLTTPAENVENLLEVDPSYLAVLFG